MPSSRQARATRSAISPRLAIRTFSNMGSVLWLEVHQHLLELDPIAVLHEDLRDLAALTGRDLIHHLHRLDDAHGLAELDTRADLHERLRARLRGAVEGAHQRRPHPDPLVLLLQVADREPRP